MKLPLHWQVLIAMILGAGFAFLFGEIGLVKSFGDIFMRLLRMVIVPLIFTSIVHGVAGIGDSKSLGRLGGKTILFYMSTSLLAILLGLILTNTIRPGIGLEFSTSAPAPDALETPGSLAEVLLRMIPTNPVAAAADFDILGVIFFSICLGATISALPEKPGQLLEQFFGAAFAAMMTMTQFIIKFLPIGVFGLIAGAIWRIQAQDQNSLEVLRSIGKYILTLSVGLSIHLFIVLPLLFFLLTRINPIRHFRAVREAMLTAFSTSSSSATLPVTMSCMRNNAGVSNRVTSFVLPMGSTINMDGTALYECLGALFIAQALGVDLPLTQQFVVVITALLASIGAAGIPSAGLVMIFIVLEAINLGTPDAYALVGLMLAIDRPLDMFRTMVNITSDTFGTAIIARSEGEKLLYDEPAGPQPATASAEIGDGGTASVGSSS